MALALQNLSFIPNQDAAGMTNGGQSTGNHNQSSLMRKFLQRALDRVLGFVINNVCGFIKDKKRRIPKLSTYNRDCLSLSTGQTLAQFSDQAIKALA